MKYILTLHLKETLFDAEQIQIRAACSGSTLFAYGNIIRCDPILADFDDLCPCSMYKRKSLFYELSIVGGAYHEYS